MSLFSKLTSQYACSEMVVARIASQSTISFISTTLSTKKRNQIPQPPRQIHILRIPYSPFIPPQRNRSSRKHHKRLDKDLFAMHWLSYISKDIHPSAHAQLLGCNHLKQRVDVHCYNGIFPCLAGVVVFEDEVACCDIVDSYA